MIVQPYLMFSGNCEAAMNFYSKAIGSPIDMLMRMKDAPEQGMCPPGNEDKVMHASMHIGKDTILMASDDPMRQTQGFSGFTLSITVEDQAAADRIYGALSAGGQQTMPLTKTFWSPYFGMLVDPFGVSWMISLPGEQ